MKNFIFAFACLFLLLGGSTLRAQDDQKSRPLLIVIDGGISSQEALDSIPKENIKEMDYLKERDARAIYGMAAAHGALLVKTKKAQNPVVFKDGVPLREDSSVSPDFQRIDVIRGQQAINLYGPGAKEGVYLYHGEEEQNAASIDVLLEVVNSKGRPLKGAQIKDEHQKLLAITNKCGMVYVENLLIGNKISIIKKNYQAKDILVSENRVKVVVEKP